MIELNSTWSLWPQFVVRTAGFSVDALASLGAERSLALVEELESAAARALDLLASSVAATESRADRRRFKRLAKRIGRDGSDALVAAADRLAEDDSPLAELAARAAMIHERLLEVHEIEQKQLRVAMAETLVGTGMLEAMTWQNRELATVVIDNLGHRKAKRALQAGRAAATYIQRYALKNDTAGFYGPAVWGRIDPAQDEMTLAPGPAVARNCRVYLEHWALSAVAETIVREHALRPFLAPRVGAAFTISGDELLTPVGPMPLAVERLRLLAAIDGETPARDVVQPLVDDGLFPTLEAGLAELESLASAGQVVWSIDLPNRGAPFERHVRARLANVPEDRQPEVMAPLEDVLRCRDRAQAARGDASATSEALADLDRTVEAATGQSATRRGGEMYAGRTPCHLHCVRDLELTLPRGFGDKLRPLQLVGTSLRHLSQTLARSYGDAIREICVRIEEQLGEVPLARLYMEALPLFPLGSGADGPPLLTSAVEQFEDAWWRLLRPDADATEATFTFDEVTKRLDDVFDTSAVGWPSAATHSPDVMIAAGNVEAIQRGDYQVVLGEIHPFICSMEQELFACDHPSPSDLARVMTEWYPHGRIVFGIPPHAPGRHVISPMTGFEQNVFLELPQTCRSHAPRDRTLSVADLVVDFGTEEGVVRTRDGRCRWGVHDFLNNLFAPSVGFVPSHVDHAPRITIDDMVLSRRKWRWLATDTSFASKSSPLARWRNTRAWARELGLPSRVFYRAPGEVKPIYLDFDSPVLADVFCKIVRQTKPTQRLSFSELLPGPEHCWLPDAEGRRYTSELRLVMHDRASVAKSPRSGGLREPRPTK